MADDADLANDYTAKHNAKAVAEHRAKMANQRTAPSLEFCEWCDEKIPTARRVAVPGCTLCVACQSFKERPKGGQ